MRWLKSIGVILAVVSWNVEWKALKALEALGLEGYFDYLVIEPHPRKDLMFERLLSMVGRVDKAVFVDDNPRMVELVKRAHPRVEVLTYSREVKSMSDVKEVLIRILDAGG